MNGDERNRVLQHLLQQAETLAKQAEQACSGDHHAQLIAIRDQVFVFRETLDTLGVPHALVSNAEWSRVVETTGGP